MKSIRNEANLASLAFDMPESGAIAPNPPRGGGGLNAQARVQPKNGKAMSLGILKA